MSIYNNEPVKLPQVKVSAHSRRKLYSYLKIFGRDYADFVRDLCDMNIKWNIKNADLTFRDQVLFTTSAIRSHYKDRRRSAEQQLSFLENIPNPVKDKRSVAEQVQIHRFPEKKIVRLPHVLVSQWQADNLYLFLLKFNRTYADFIRTACENVFVDMIEAQAGVPQFSGTNMEIFLKVFDEIVNVEQLRGKKISKEWPTGYWQQRRAARNRSAKYGQKESLGR